MTEEEERRGVRGGFYEFDDANLLRDKFSWGGQGLSSKEESLAGRQCAHFLATGKMLSVLPRGYRAHAAAAGGRIERRSFAASAALKPTLVHSHHVAEEGKLVDFAGYAMPLSYSTKGKHGLSIIDSCIWTRENASLFDVSHMCSLKWRGKGVWLTLVDVCALWSHLLCCAFVFDAASIRCVISRAVSPE